MTGAAPSTPAVPEQPRLRAGTGFGPLKGGAVFLNGPHTDAFIIDEGTATLLQACDGRSLGEVAADLDARYGWGLSAEEVRGLLTRWAAYGYLEETPLRSRRLLKFDPALLLRVLSPIRGLYGKRPVALLALLLAAAGYVLTFLEGPDLVPALSSLIRWSPPAGALLVIAGYYLGYSVTAFFHELGHAQAIRRFDGEVPEIGVQKSLSFYVLSNREVLEQPADRIWYYAGGLLSDTVWWVGAWVWWLLSPGPVPLLLLVPQCLYFLIYAFAPSGASDMALILREAVGWDPLPRARRGTDWRARWRAAPGRQVAMEITRLVLSALVLVIVALDDVWLLLVYACYRLLRKTLNRL